MVYWILYEEYWGEGVDAWNWVIIMRINPTWGTKEGLKFVIKSFPSLGFMLWGKLGCERLSKLKIKKKGLWGD